MAGEGYRVDGWRGTSLSRFGPQRSARKLLEQLAGEYLTEVINDLTVYEQYIEVAVQDGDMFHLEVQ
jgi:hypothetical protein